MKANAPRKLVDLEQLVAIVNDLHRAGRRVVFTNGCFDIIHPGHILHLQQARAEGDVLVIALNSDESVRKLKGEGRPVFGQNERALVLAALEPVDYIIIFDTLRVTHIIQTIRPDIYIKGGDYTLDTLDAEEHQVMENLGTQIMLLPKIGSFSTTNVIEHVRKNCCQGINRVQRAS